MLRRLFCAVFHRRYRQLQPFLMAVKPFGGWRKVCWRCDQTKAARRYTGPVERRGGEWKPARDLGRPAT